MKSIDETQAMYDSARAREVEAEKLTLHCIFRALMMHALITRGESPMHPATLASAEQLARVLMPSEAAFKA